MEEFLNNMKNILKVTFVIIGTMIGAGFASGREIEMFFNYYGIKGILGLLVSSILTGVIIYKTFQILRKHQISSYEEFLSAINQRKNVNKIMNIIIQMFLFISFYIMVAGFSAYFYQEFQIPILLSSVMMTILCYFTFQKDIRGVVSINTILIPALIAFVAYLGIKNLGFTYQNLVIQKNIQILNCSSILHNWFVSSILYASYNSIMLIPILIELSQYMDSNKKIKATSIACTSILNILGICLFCLLLRGGNYISELELPMTQIVKEFGTAYQWIYGIVIIAAIFTSAISAGYGFLKNCSKTKKEYQYLNLFLCFSSILVANVGFSKLVSLLYPIFGFLGLLQIFYIVKYANL